MRGQMITVYSKPRCQQCTATKRWLDKRGIVYNPVDLSQDAQALAAVKELGYEGAPVTIVSNGDPETDIHWYGFNPTFLEKYTQQEKAA